MKRREIRLTVRLSIGEDMSAASAKDFLVGAIKGEAARYDDWHSYAKITGEVAFYRTPLVGSKHK